MRIWKDVWDYAKMIIIVVLIVTLINNVVLINAKIPSESMEKTVMTGDRLFGFRLAYGINIDLFGHEISKKIKDPERFDIIIFKYPDDEKKLFIKRLIGLPGEKVQITDGKVYINDSEIPLDDSFIPEKARGNFGPYEVPEPSPTGSTTIPPGCCPVVLRTPTHPCTIRSISQFLLWMPRSS